MGNHRAHRYPPSAAPAIQGPNFVRTVNSATATSATPPDNAVRTGNQRIGGERAIGPMKRQPRPDSPPAPIAISAPPRLPPIRPFSRGLIDIHDRIATTPIASTRRPSTARANRRRPSTHRRRSGYLRNRRSSDALVSASAHPGDRTVSARVPAATIHRVTAAAAAVGAQDAGAERLPMRRRRADRVALHPVEAAFGADQDRRRAGPRAHRCQRRLAPVSSAKESARPAGQSAQQRRQLDGSAISGRAVRPHCSAA